MHTFDTIFFALWALFSLGFGILMIGLQACLFYSTRNIDEWPIAQGIITVSKIREQHYRRSIFIPEIHYRYLVSGTEFERNAINLNGKQTFNLQVAQDWISQYPVGKQVDVFYNPANPQMAFLEKSVSLKGIIFLLFLSLLLIAFGFFLLYMEFVY